MNEFSTVLGMTADAQKPLADVLLRAAVLSHRFKSRNFRSWIEAESNGYQTGSDLPEYRVVSCVTYGIFRGLFPDKQEQLSLRQQHEESSCCLVEVGLSLSISAIEKLLPKGDATVLLDAADVRLFSLACNAPPCMELVGAYRLIPDNQLVSVLYSARHRLLKFLLELQAKYPDLRTDDAMPEALSERDVDSALKDTIYSQCSWTTIMGDTYSNTGQTGAMGPGAKAENMNFIQILRESIGESSLGELARELETLRTNLLTEAKTAEQDAAVAEVAQAEEAAKKGDARGVLSRLKSAGKWAFDVATKIGTSVAAKAIEKSMGLS